jgi:hypothetical protein
LHHANRRPRTLRRLAITGGLLTLSSFLTTSAHASLPGVNGPIVVANAGISIYDPDGTLTTQLPVAGRVEQPTVSPDGTRIVYTDETSLFILHPDGSGLTQVPAGVVGRQGEPAWSPNGARIVFQGGITIWTESPGGGGQTELTADCPQGCGYPSWSPNGAKIAYERGADYHSEIYVMSSTGANPVSLTASSPVNDYQPDWSPDGTKLVFTTESGLNTAIAIMNANGSGRSIIPNTLGGQWPTWSPDGSMIAFVDSKTWVLKVVALDGSQLRSLGPGLPGRPSWQAVQSHLTLHAASGAVTLPAGIDLGGSLALLGRSAAGEIVHLFVTPPGAERQALGDATVGVDGTYSYHVQPTGPGTWTFDASWSSDGTLKGASAGAVSVNVDARDPGLALQTSVKVVKFGNAVTVTAHLAHTHTNRVVSIYRTSFGGTKTLLISQEVGALGNASVTVRPKLNTLYTAEYAGDDYDLAATATAAVSVRPIYTTDVVGDYTVVSGYHLFHYSSRCATSGVGCPLYTVTLAPNLAGKYVGFQLEKLSRTGGWGYVETVDVRLNYLSRAAIRFRYLGTGVKTQAFRLSVGYSGRAVLPSLSAYTKLRITA